QGTWIAPLQWGRRPTPTETSTWQTSATSCSFCFNGAAGLRRRRREHTVVVALGVTPLQWGRRPTPTETDDQVRVPRALRDASMGPPAYADGDTLPVDQGGEP